MHHRTGGTCEFCVHGYTYHCVNKALPFRSGGFTEYVRVKDSAIFDLADSVDDALGAFVESLAVSTHGVRLVGVRPGMTGVVIGAGTIGLCAIGAEDVLPDDLGSAINRIRQAAPHGADFVIEAVGGGQATIDQATRFLAPVVVSGSSARLSQASR